MKTKRISTEQMLYGLAFLLAVTLRLWCLGAKPLSDGEARLALEAFGVGRGESLATSIQPVYAFFTGGLFWLFGSNDFLARLLPALAGSLLVLATYAFRTELGSKTSLILAFGLSLDPGMVALSRMADGPMLAIGFTFLTIGLALNRRWSIAAIFLGLALLSGAAFYSSLLVFGFSGVGWGWLLRRARSVSDGGQVPNATIKLEGIILPAVISLVITLMLAGTLFFRYPSGLGAWLNGLPAYLETWTHPSGIPGLRLPAGLIIYQPLAILFALVSAIRGGRNLIAGVYNPRSLPIATLLAAVSLLLGLINPGRQVGDLGWVLIFVWVLASIELRRAFFLPITRKLVSVGLAGMIILLMAIFWLQLAGLSTNIPTTSLDFIRPVIVITIFALAGLMTWLVASGWSWEIARLGLIWGVVASLTVYLLAEVWGIISLTPSLQEIERQELWPTFPQAGQVRLLSDTLDDLSKWKVGQGAAIDISVNLDSPSLHWALRSFEQTSYLPEDKILAPAEMGKQTLPLIIITRKDAKPPSEAASYRGQDFIWWRQPGWEGILPPDFLKWLIYRTAAWQDEQIIVWARGDLFPGGLLTPQNGPNSPGEEIDPLLKKPIE